MGNLRIVLDIRFANFWHLHDAYSNACGFDISTSMLPPLACTTLNFSNQCPVRGVLLSDQVTGSAYVMGADHVGQVAVASYAEQCS